MSRMVPPIFVLLFTAILAVAFLPMPAGLADPPAYTGKGEGFYREPVDGKKEDAHDQCMKEKREIVDQIKALRELYEEYVNQPGHETLMKMIRQEYDRLKQRYDDLMKTCPGAQPGDPAWKIPDYVPPLEPDPKDKPIQSDVVGNTLLTVGVTGLLGGGAEAGGEEAAGFFGDEAGGAMGEVSAKEAATKALEIGVHVGIDQAADAGYDAIQEGRHEESTSGNATPEREETGRHLSRARADEMRALSGFSIAYARSRAALQSGDAKSAANHLAAAMQFSQLAIAQARAAAMAQANLQRGAYQVAAKNFAALVTKRDASRDEIARRAQQIAQSGLPKTWVEQLTAAGVSQPRIDALRRSLASLTAAQVQSILAAEKDRITLDDGMKANLAKANSKAPWPEPRELPEISSLTHQARAQLEQLKETRINLSAADVAGKPAKLPQMWAVPAGQPPRLNRDNLLRGADSGPLVPGKYDVYLDEADDSAAIPSAVCLARGVQVEQGKPLQLPLRSGIRLKTTGKLPAPTRWFVVPADAPFATAVARRNGNTAEPAWLPPGDYDVYSLQNSNQRQPVCIARGVKVDKDAMGDLNIPGCAAQIETASWIPPRNASSGWLGLVQSGDERRNAVAWSKSASELVAPPGTYDLVWMQGGGRSRPMTLTSGVKLSPDTPLKIAVNTGMKLKLPQNAPALDPRDGWWGAMPAFGNPSDPTNSCKGRTDQPLLLPAGVYDVVWKQDGKHQPRKIATEVTVSANNDGPTVVNISSGNVFAEPTK